MALSGGGDRSWLKPLKPNGHLNEDTPEGADIAGTHKGFYGGLNVANPEPGFTYQWIRNDPRDIYLARQRGWSVVDCNGPDKPAYMLAGNESDAPTQLDTAGVFKDIIFVRMPEDKHRRLHEETRLQSEAQLRGGTDAFLDGASDAESATGHTDRGRVPTRMARSEHGLQAQQDGETVRLDSQSGILQE